MGQRASTISIGLRRDGTSVHGSDLLQERHEKGERHLAARASTCILGGYIQYQSGKLGADTGGLSRSIAARSSLRRIRERAMRRVKATRLRAKAPRRVASDESYWRDPARFDAEVR